jgi:hypothetical protein
MKKFLFTIGLATAAGLLAGPAAALGAGPPGEVSGYAALTPVDSAGNAVSVPIHAGETVAVTAGVGVIGSEAAPGTVLKVSVDLDVHLPRLFTNCWYFITNGGSEGAWCQFDKTLEPQTPYRLSPFKASAGPNATADTIEPVTLQWYRADYGSELGGVEGLAKANSGPDTPPVRGKAGPLKLKKTDKLVMKNSPSFGYAYLHLVPTEDARQPLRASRPE